VSPMLTTQRVTTPRDIDAVAVLAHEIWNQPLTTSIRPAGQLDSEKMPLGVLTP